MLLVIAVLIHTARHTTSVKFSYHPPWLPGTADISIAVPACQSPMNWADCHLLKQSDIAWLLYPSVFLMLLSGLKICCGSAAHAKSSMFGCSLDIPITAGRLNLGTWQVCCQHVQLENVELHHQSLQDELH